MLRRSGNAWSSDHPWIFNLLWVLLGAALLALVSAGWRWRERRTMVSVRVQPIDQAVVVGDWNVTLQDLTCGFPQYKRRDARGVFCVLSVVVVNQGKAAIPIFPGPWKLFDSEDHEYPLTGAGDDGFGPLFSGQAGEGVAIFDVASLDVLPVRLIITAPKEKEASAFSAEVAITSVGKSERTRGR